LIAIVKLEWGDGIKIEINMIFFTVIITTYNRANLVATAVKSVIHQTFQDFELIIVDDASTDGTEKIIKQFEDSRIRYFKNESNLHKGGARNKGIELSSGQHICFLDDDDYYLPNHLDTFANYLMKNRSFEGLLFTMPTTQKIGEQEIKKSLLPEIGDTHPVAYLFHHKNGVPTPRVCIPSNILKVFKFNENIRIGQDTELFLRIASRYQIIPIFKNTVVQVKHEENSGALKFNSGKYRLEGYKYIFSNKDVAKFIPWTLKNYMISYCYRRMTDHYNYIGDQRNTLKSAFKSLYYSPFDKDFKIKIVYILYNLPLIGSKIKSKISSTSK